MVPASDDFDFGIGLKKFADGLQRAGQVLFVAIQIREDVAGCAAVAAIDGIIHAGILFDECLDARIVRQPVLRAVIGTGILHDMFELDILLVGHGGDAELEPAGTAETGRDDGKFQGQIFNLFAPPLAIKLISWVINSLKAFDSPVAAFY